MSFSTTWLHSLDLTSFVQEDLLVEDFAEWLQRLISRSNKLRKNGRARRVSPWSIISLSANSSRITSRSDIDHPLEGGVWGKTMTSEIRPQQ